MTVIAARVMPGSDAAQRIGHEPATTDDLGRYRIYGLEPGEYVVAVEGRSIAEARAPQPGVRASLTGQELMAFLTTFHPSTLVESSAQRIQLAPGRDAAGVDVVAVRARRFRVAGVVLDSQGVPLASANGGLSRAGSLGATSHGFTSDAAGRFTVASVEPGEYTLTLGGGTWSSPVSSTGRREAAELPLVVAADFEDIVVVTQPGITVAGRVVLIDSPEASAPKVRIAFRRGDSSIWRSPDIEATVDHLQFQGADLFGPRLVRVSGLPTGWAVKSILLNDADITDVPTVFTKEHDGRLQVVLSSRLSALEGEVRDETGKATEEAIVYVFSEDRRSWSLASPRTVFSDVRPDGRFRVGELTGGRYFAIAVAREGLRMPQSPREAFFDVLSREATPFVIGDDDRRTLELRVWRWPE
jgi:protocatechuate 3,4-dioxygenase beta subunit